MIDSQFKIRVITSFFVKRLFIPLLFAIALPTSVNANDADSYYKECIIKAIDKTSRQMIM